MNKLLLLFLSTVALQTITSELEGQRRTAKKYNELSEERRALKRETGLLTACKYLSRFPQFKKTKRKSSFNNR